MANFSIVSWFELSPSYLASFDLELGQYEGAGRETLRLKLYSVYTEYVYVAIKPLLGFISLKNSASLKFWKTYSQLE